MIVLLAGYAVIWTAAAIIRNIGLPLHGDMLEAFSLSRSPALGYLKHPPLLDWVTAAWFSFMPVAGWCFYLLALLNTALAMWLVWLAARHITVGRRQILAVALLASTPIFTFHAAVFNHDTIQMSLWPLVALAFFVSIERSNAFWSIPFGVAAGIAILAKYYAGLIVVACAMAALLHPGRRVYFHSPRPYLAAAVCLIVAGPNLYWLATHDFVSITYHVELERQRIAAAGDGGTLTVLIQSLFAVGAFLAALSPVFALLWLCLRPWTQAMVRSIIFDWPQNRPVVACIAILPVVLPLLVMPFAGIALRDPWNYPAYFFVPLVILSAPRLFVTYRATALILVAIAAGTVICVAISPALMVGNFLLANDDNAQPLNMLAKTATAIWHERTGQPLKFVSGLGYERGIVFYSSEHPLPTVDGTGDQELPALEKLWDKNGVLAICRPAATWCDELFATALPQAERIQITIPNTFLGLHRASDSYVLYIQRPPSPNER